MVQFFDFALLCTVLAFSFQVIYKETNHYRCWAIDVCQPEVCQTLACGRCAPMSLTLTAQPTFWRVGQSYCPFCQSCITWSSWTWAVTTSHVTRWVNINRALKKTNKQLNVLRGENENIRGNLEFYSTLFLDFFEAIFWTKIVMDLPLTLWSTLED